MKPRLMLACVFLVSTLLLLTLNGCNATSTRRRKRLLPLTSFLVSDPALFAVEHPEQFPLAAAAEHPTTSELVVTGTVMPDVSRNVPVVRWPLGASWPFTRDSATPCKKASCC